MANIELKKETYNDLKLICYDMFDKGEIITVNKAFDLLMKLKNLPMHCPYHHFILPAAMLTLTAIIDGKSKEELEEWLNITEERAMTVPGGFCGNCGTCGSGVGMGLFVSVYTGASPMSVESWQIANEVTGRSLIKIAEYTGPRCCKRTAYLAATAAIPYVNEILGTKLTIDKEIKCEFNRFNAECLHEKCPFYNKEK